MKKLYTRKSIRMSGIYLLLIILLIGCFSEEHLKFTDVPINGNIDLFADELIKLGYAEAPSITENEVNLNGIFIKKQCEIKLFASDKSHTVYQVKVNLPKESRDSLAVSFGRIQELCSSKYGIGKSRFYQYRNSDRFHFNEPRKIRQLNPGDFTRYTTTSGVIIVEVLSGSISITFTDRHNSEIQKSEMGLGGESAK